MVSAAHMYSTACDLHRRCRWGVTDEIKGQAEHLSKLNDVRVAVLDLYKGKIGVDAEEASHVSVSTQLAARSRVASACHGCIVSCIGYITFLGVYDFATYCIVWLIMVT